MLCILCVSLYVFSVCFIVLCRFILCLYCVCFIVYVKKKNTEECNHLLALYDEKRKKKQQQSMSHGTNNRVFSKGRTVVLSVTDCNAISSTASHINYL